MNVNAIDNVLDCIVKVEFVVELGNDLKMHTW